MNKNRPILYGALANNVSMGKGGKKAIIKHLQPGIVRYQNDDGSSTTYLLELEAIEAMRPTAVGIPVVGKSGGFDHVRVEEGKEYDGRVIDGFWDGESGWEAFNVDGMNVETAKACERGFQASCAYIPTETDGKPGLWHNCEYDEKILNGQYTHVAIVSSPRYEGATIELLNSIGGTVMNKVLKAALSLVPLAQLREVFNSIEDDEKKKADLEKKNADAKAEKRAAAQSAYDAAMKNASSDEDRTKAKEAFEKANAEADAPVAAPVEAPTAPEAAPKSDLPPEPLGGGNVPPEPGVPAAALAIKPNAVPPAIAAEAAAEGETPEHEAAENAALGNAADKCKDCGHPALEHFDEGKLTHCVGKGPKKGEEGGSGACGCKGDASMKGEKKNAEDAAAAAAKKKAEDEEKEKTNALKVKKDQAEAVAKALRTERFNNLRKLAEERGGSASSPFVGIDTEADKENLGRSRYGSRQ